MGQSQSSRNEGRPPPRASGHREGRSSNKPVSKRAAPEPEEAPTALKLDRDYDTVIIATSQDGNLTQYIQRELETLAYSVFANTAGSEEKSKLMGQAVLASKLLVFVASDHTAGCSECTELTSLGYISDKPIVIAATSSKQELLKKLPFGMKLTLESLPWFEVGDGTQQGPTFDAFKAEVKAKLPVATGGAAEPVVEATATVEVSPPVTHSAPADSPPKEGEGTSFWADSFGDQSRVPWEEFERAFTVAYLGEFDENMQPWVLKTVKGDMFGGSDEVTRDSFEIVCRPGRDFGKLVTRHVMERWAIQEIFSMDSSVRLTSIENLGKIQSPAVVDALLALLGEPDPNIRAVAAISLGRTEHGGEGEMVMDRLMTLLEDKDRIVRQSACLSLGRLKATKAVPKISHIWRNDFISTVREAAHTALGQIGGAEAEKVLRVTDILQKEIAYLAKS